MQKLLGALAVGLALVLGLVAAPAAVAAPEGLLYVQQAAGGTLRKLDGRWRLTLQQPARQVTTFADRPARCGGQLGLRRFVSGWRAAFGEDPPNAALEVSGAPSARDVILLELGRPRLDGRGDRITWGSATIAVDAPVDRPLGGNSVLPSSGTVTGSWAGGPVQTFPGFADGGGPFTLQPGS